ncbi:glutamate--tRNA ligase [Acetohalobium arabaticum]|uniref:Glutamate--tRNA ligase n=1 Tax=Acetohalobium arabaticum (strain ATCC 49924 / DSM 5501 / Z-7288) TaxID=574087 RepID=D9QT02_ACEAZ|nr:glutamate--tRNA ligase [Acetohalobium arabaticum]ADL11690.1 glutamyl-tRNA synthetase; glutamate--tRNA(Gln) ligase [Acetohalobium arabaticum DSM 5501]
MSDIRVRFAPSPTGQIHIGNIRTALFTWLYARKHNGTTVLRIEDTDQERSTSEFEEIILQETDWLGLDWDEGVRAGGDYGPYRQSDRLDIYDKYIDRLIEEDKAYYCYCTDEELEQMREEAKAKGKPPKYNGRCRNLSEEERKELEAEGREPAVRFKMPTEEIKIVVNDLVHGEVEFSSEVLDDFVIVKSDGLPTYNFAVVIDDHLMEISHVIRGEDHLSNTPKQQLIYDALDWEMPEFGHLPMILGEDKSKLSKRSGEAYVYVSEYRQKGYLPEALINFLALLGWSSADDEELFTVEEIIDNFSMERVNNSPSVFDVEKLNWMNGHHIRESELDRIVDLAIPYLQEAGYIADELSDEEYNYVAQIVDVVRDSLDYVAQITDHVDIFFGELEYENKEEVIDCFQQEDVDLVLETLKDRLAVLDDYSPDSVLEEMRAILNDLPVGGRLFYHPTRYALTGKGSGPELYQVVSILGKEETINRLDKALNLV